MTVHKAVDEVLEFVWSEREEGRNSIKHLIDIPEVAEAEADMDTLKGMEADGMLRLDGDSVFLTDKGEEEAKAAIRRHRLAERLLTEVLNMDSASVEEDACGFEHTLSPEVTESICTLLGHPPTCPHGLPIPPGECCNKAAGELKPLVQPLNKLDIGERGRIIFISSKSPLRLDKLSTLGIVPGSVLKVCQKRPAFVIQLGETSLALDSEIINEIYVRTVR